jgi:hypothetical protein
LADVRSHTGEQPDRRNEQNFTLKNNLFLYFFNFPVNFLTAIFLVIGFKQGNSPAMGEKKEAVTV